MNSQTWFTYITYYSVNRVGQKEKSEIIQKLS